VKNRLKAGHGNKIFYKTTYLDILSWRRSFAKIAMAAPIIPVLPAGAAGTRLWPVSRDALCKWFLPLVAGGSTYQETLLGVRGPIFAPPIAITSRQ
jgi:hypothetical protein